MCFQSVLFCGMLLVTFFIHLLQTFLPKYRRGLAMRMLSVRPSVCPSVCLSVRLSVKRVDCDKMEERSVQIFITYERSFSLVFWKEERLVHGRRHLPAILGQLAPVGAKSPILKR